EPVGVARPGDAALVAEVGRLERERNAGRTFAVALIAVADGAPRGVDLLASRDHRCVCPHAQRDVDIRVLEWSRYVSVAARLLVLLAVGLRRRGIAAPETDREHHHRDHRERPGSDWHAESPQK